MVMKKYYEEPDFKEIIFRVNDVIMASGNSVIDPTKEVYEWVDDDDWKGGFSGTLG